MPSQLPWHLVDEVYVPVNYNENFHWVLAIIALKDRCIHVYDSLSSIINMESINEVHKLDVILPTYLSDSGFFEETSRIDWANIEAYRDKMNQKTQFVNQNSFEVEYIQDIMQQEYNSVDCGAFVAGYAEYISERMSVPSVDFEAEYHRM
ncbi:hypothetical protein BC332_28948 [Capsicum chinense]|nr:hypothetical protein BC332_28948 [Capsicum chinense]